MTRRELKRRKGRTEGEEREREVGTCQTGAVVFAETINLGGWGSTPPHPLLPFTGSG